MMNIRYVLCLLASLNIAPLYALSEGFVGDQTITLTNTAGKTVYLWLFPSVERWQDKGVQQGKVAYQNPKAYVFLNGILPLSTNDDRLPPTTVLQPGETQTMYVNVPSSPYFLSLDTKPEQIRAEHVQHPTIARLDLKPNSGVVITSKNNTLVTEADRDALRTASQKGDLATVQLLLNRPLSPRMNANDTDHQGETPLMKAVYAPTTAVLQELLKPENKPNINHQDSLGSTALHHAAKQNNLSAVQLLLTHKADPNILGGKKVGEKKLTQTVTVMGDSDYHYSFQATYFTAAELATNNDVKKLLQPLTTARTITRQEKSVESN